MIYMNPPFNIGGELMFDDREGYFDRYPFGMSPVRRWMEV